MKLIATLAAFAIMAGFSLDASAQDGRKKHAILKKFDKDGDGKLSEQERAAAKEFKDKRRGEEGRGGGKLRRKIFRHFDKDGDRRLNDDERGALKKFLESDHKKGRSHRRRR